MSEQKSASERQVDQISNQVEQYAAKRDIRFDQALVEVRSRFPAVRVRLDLCSQYPSLMEIYAGKGTSEKMERENTEFQAEFDQLVSLSK